MVKTPKKLYAGDSASWLASFPEFLASEGWSLSYVLSNANGAHTITSTPIGDDFQVQITSTASSAFAPGRYSLIGYVEQGDDRHVVSESSLEVFPNITEAVDRRSQAERTLQAIRDMIEGKASDDQQMIQYQGRTLSRYTFEQLIMIESRLARTVAREHARKSGSRGFIGVTLR